MSKPALIVIDLQNDYFEGGRFPLWKPGQALAAAQKAIRAARDKGIPVVYVQHIAAGPSPFFTPDTEGVKIHAAIQAGMGDAPLVVKRHADAFEGTPLHHTLQELGVDELLVCGMMTQNCVTHTAISRRADDYRKVTVLSDACTTVTEMLHRIALNALSTRVTLATVDEALA
ncbi:MAG TPA: cysteine hydrolase family protein [Ramlibacter sp.]|uniref:cysteine hydrolase family protein n=1 Tax=Ramlibacter sp. TaxID=1917967 RepID=UPI002D7E9974|nr:cysteine hydrolase family protein [Ramlibacter sp.]HET8745713.1 cysteine hydrolase family protein [Ramlibacter sp.]